MTDQTDTATPPPADYAARLNRALRSESVAFQTYALMYAAAFAGGTITKARLSIVTGTSYQIVNHQIARTRFFDSDDSGPLVTVSLNEDGRAKLDRINAKLARNY
ncbi:hypothetical protein [Haloferula sp. A504]|uniref:hypothetical protein n=1 Tax=Haloferula sp. A504 TaxID=3373601 RepID=UPI0031C8D98D|nr:hypothetical protein [Verrucomicrobiaceae bacterium E54]